MKSILLCMLISNFVCIGQQPIKRQTFYDYDKTQLKEIYLVSPVAPYKKNGYYKLYNKNTVLIKECVYKDGKLNGAYKEMYNDGSPKLTTTYKNDEFNGLTRQYYSNGVLQSESFFTNGIVNGKFLENYENGSRKLESMFANGKENGITKQYFENGRLNFEREMKDGVFHGTYKEYYPTGSIRYDAQAVMGIKDGAFKHYYENGKLQAEGTFIANQQSGVWNKYTQSGILLSQTTMEAGENHGVEKLYSNGKGIIVTNNWDMGSLNQPGSVVFSSAAVTEANGNYQNLFHGTEYGIESDWIDLNELNYTSEGHQGNVKRKENGSVKIKVRIRKHFTEPGIIYLLFDNEKNSDFLFYNLIFAVNKNTIFDDYYNFGIGKLGKRYDPQIFSNLQCNEAAFQISIAAENPNSEFDNDEQLSDEEIILKRSKKVTSSNAIGWMQERRMNSTFGGVKPPDYLIIKPTCEAINKFQQIIKLASYN